MVTSVITAIIFEEAYRSAAVVTDVVN